MRKPPKTGASRPFGPKGKSVLAYIMGDSETKDNTNKMVENTDILLYYGRTRQEKSPRRKSGRAVSHGLWGQAAGFRLLPAPLL